MTLTDSLTRFGAALLMCTSAVASGAQTLAEKLTFCENAGLVAMAATEAREKGISKGEAQALVQDAKLDGNQAAFLTALISLTYAMQGVDSPLMRQVAIQMCHKSMGLK